MMFKIFLRLFLLVVFISVSTSNAQPFLRSYPGFFTGYDILPTPDGNYIICAIFSDTLGYHPAFLKINIHGDTLWTRKYYTGKIDWAGLHNACICHDGGFLLVTGHEHHRTDSLRLFRYDANANLLWARTEPQLFVIDAFCGIELANREFLIGAYDSIGYCLVHTDSLGLPVRRTRVTIIDANFIFRDFRCTGNGDFYLLGYNDFTTNPSTYLYHYNSNDSLLSARRISQRGGRLSIDAHYNSYIFSDTYAMNDTGSDGRQLVANSFDSTGSLRWSRRYGIRYGNFSTLVSRVAFAHDTCYVLASPSFLGIFTQNGDSVKTQLYYPPWFLSTLLPINDGLLITGYNTTNDLLIMRTNTDGTLNTSDRSNYLPSQSELSCYPNPFNPTTTIRFSLPQHTEIDLRVFDVNGREVANLASGVFQAGEHSVPFDGKRMVSGLYFAKLTNSKNEVKIQKMMLVK